MAFALSTQGGLRRWTFTVPVWALLAASVLAGSLWTAFGPAMTFYAGAAIAAVALLGLLAKKA